MPGNTDPESRWLSLPYEAPDAEGLVLEALNDGPLVDIFAGAWDDAGQLHVAVVGDIAEARAAIERVSPEAHVVISQARYSYLELRALSSEILECADRLGARISTIGIDDVANRVGATLYDFAAPASAELRRAFIDRPVTWDELTIAFATPPVASTEAGIR